MKNYLLGFVCLSTFLFSCKEKQEAVTNTSKKTLGKLNTDSTAPPIVIPFTQTPAKLTPGITSMPVSLDENLGKEVITTLSSEMGLPLGFYREVLQDDLGNLWMNNNQEIVKYDGNSFQTYKPPVNEYAIEKILIDKQNNIWAVVWDAEANQEVCFYFNGISFQPAPGIPSFGIENHVTIDQGPDKRIWITNQKQKSITIYDGLQLVNTIDIKANAFKRIYSLNFENNNTVWINDRDDTALTRYDGSQFIKYTTKDGLPEAGLRFIIPITNDSLYIHTNKGIFLFKSGKATKIFDGIGLGIFADRQKRVWIPERTGKVIRRSSDGDIIFGEEDGFDGANFFYNDNQNNIWAGTSNKLYRFYRPIVNFRNIFPNNKEERVAPFIHDKKDNYWFSSLSSGLYRYDGKQMINYSFSNKPANNDSAFFNIYVITQDQKSNIWINNSLGNLIKFDGQNFTDYSKLGTPAFPVLPYGLFIDSKNNVWFSFRTTRLFNTFVGAGYFNGKETVYYGTAQGLPDKEVNCIYEDSKGMMWFGTANGLSRFDGKQFTNYREEDGLPDNHVQSIMEDGYGQLWIGTDDGLSRFDGKRFFNYGEEDGISSENIVSIQKSPEKDHLWLNTQAGITAMHFHTADSISFENLNELNGFPVKRSRFLFDKAGILWTSDERNSLKRIDYNKVVDKAKPFPIHLSNIRINNSSLCWNNLLPGNKTDSVALYTEMQHRFGKVLQNDALNEMKQQFEGIKFDSLIPFDFIPANLVLPYSTNAVGIEFAAIDPQFSKHTQYQYMLEGFDKTWSPLSRNTNANFGKLTEGRYTFKVKALNIYGLWSETSYSFRVLPPWYRTWWEYTIYVLFFLGALRIFSKWRERRLRHEKETLQVKVEERTSELKKSLEELKSTQSQLIQSEKMASLGELTAGIAHEIQNPLNFVNNFSEVNKELLVEMNEEIDKENLGEVKSIAKNVIDNEEKISFHGKRADAIVKGMLQHSRSSSGVKEPTDINALCDEYLRLSYHGLRAKDKSFNAKFETDFDESIGNINIVPQDIGRVVLNLINNAFYAASLPSKGGFPESDKNKTPTVWVSTSKIPPLGGGGAGNVLISVKDNGPGIPKDILDKIFQPFFTTKPTGQGTGLGLSLSYDIVKTHGGELKVETKEARPDDPVGRGEGSTFIIQLPIS